jgi:hypothetical protein
MRPRWRGYRVYFARQVDVVYVLLHGGDKNLNSGTLHRQKRFGPKSGGALDMIELREFDAADYLDDDQTIAAFLADAAKDENPDVFLSALSAVARKRSSYCIGWMSHLLGRAWQMNFEWGFLYGP